MGLGNAEQVWVLGKELPINLIVGLALLVDPSQLFQLNGPDRSLQVEWLEVVAYFCEDVFVIHDQVRQIRQPLIEPMTASPLFQQVGLADAITVPPPPTKTAHDFLDLRVGA